MKQLAAIFALAICACGAPFDNTVFEANREQRASTLAGRACDRYADCNTFASGQTYQTRTDCEADYKAKAMNLWPSDKCGNGQINDAKFQQCLDRVAVQACTQSFFDSVSALGECNASNVCSDPRRD